MPNSLVQLSVLGKSITGEVKIPLLELQSALQVNAIDDVQSPSIRKYFEDHIVVRSKSGVWKTNITGLQTSMDHDPFVGDYEEVIVRFELIPSVIEDLRHFTFDYDAVIHQVVTHRILIFLQSDWRNGIAEEESSAYPVGVIEMDVPTGKINPLQISLEEGSWFKGVRSMFCLGMRHIVEGLDHMLFLLTLLLVAPLAIADGQWSFYQGWKYTLFRFLKISAAFTLGHSVTLLIGALNIVRFNVQYVEVLIAVSILISAVNCTRPVFFRREAAFAAGFGLIHGLAFSVSLAHLNLDTNSKLLSVLGFNLGIEAMQLIIMLGCFPLLLLSKTKLYPSFRVAIAAVAVVVSVAWIFERVSSHENFVTHYVNMAFS